MLLFGREWQLNAFSFKLALHLEGHVFLRKCLTLPMQLSNNTFWETVCCLFFVLRTSPWSPSKSPTSSAQKMKSHLPKLQVSLPCSTLPSSRYSFCRMCSRCFPPDFFFNIHLFNLFIYFWLCWVFVATSRLCSASGEQEVLSGCGAWASHWSGFSGCRARGLGHKG